MDQQKQIEEMVTNLLAAYNGARQFEGTLMLDTIFDMAKYLVNKYQPKIPENAVVLTREEYERLKKQDLFMKDYTVVEVLENETKKARKETAEKFAEIADEKSEYFDMGNGYIYKAVHIEDVYGICKEITEGKV
jgi:phage pi2 protein 07